MLNVFKRFFRSRFVEVAFGLHARAIGDELIEMMEEFLELKQKTGLQTPYLDELMTYVPH